MKKPLEFYDDVAALERYLNVPQGTLRNIPIYARTGAVDAILKVRQMEQTSLFRPGLYYIVLADLCGNTAFNAKYGDSEGDVRTRWFQTAAIQSVGAIAVSNYVAFNKTIGDAALLIFSAFKDGYEWSSKFSENLVAMAGEYPENMEIRGVEYDVDGIEERLAGEWCHAGEGCQEPFYFTLEGHRESPAVTALSSFGGPNGRIEEEQ